MELEIVKNNYLEKIESLLNDCDFLLYELNIVNDFDSNIFQVLVENKDTSKKNIDFDTLVKANEVISEFLDSLTEITDTYILEVASAGAEKTVKNIETLKNNVGNYFFIKTKKSIEDFDDFFATLNDCQNDEFSFSFFIKGRPKKVKLTWDEIEFIRFAVKF